MGRASSAEPSNIYACYSVSPSHPCKVQATWAEVRSPRHPPEGITFSRIILSFSYERTVSWRNIDPEFVVGGLPMTVTPRTESTVPRSPSLPLFSYMYGVPINRSAPECLQQARGPAHVNGTKDNSTTAAWIVPEVSLLGHFHFHFLVIRWVR